MVGEGQSPVAIRGGTTVRHNNIGVRMQNIGKLTWDFDHHEENRTKDTEELYFFADIRQQSSFLHGSKRITGRNGARGRRSVHTDQRLRVDREACRLRVLTSLEIERERAPKSRTGLDSTPRSNPATRSTGRWPGLLKAVHTRWYCLSSLSAYTSKDRI